MGSFHSSDTVHYPHLASLAVGLAVTATQLVPQWPSSRPLRVWKSTLLESDMTKTHKTTHVPGSIVDWGYDPVKCFSPLRGEGEGEESVRDPEKHCNQGIL